MNAPNEGLPVQVNVSNSDSALGNSKWQTVCALGKPNIFGCVP